MTKQFTEIQNYRQHSVTNSTVLLINISEGVLDQWLIIGLNQSRLLPKKESDQASFAEGMQWFDDKDQSVGGKITNELK